MHNRTSRFTRQIHKVNRVFLHVGNFHDFLDRVVNLSTRRGKVILELANEDGCFLWIERRQRIVSRHALAGRRRDQGTSGILNMAVGDKGRHSSHPVTGGAEQRQEDLVGGHDTAAG